MLCVSVCGSSKFRKPVVKSISQLAALLTSASRPRSSSEEFSFWPWQKRSYIVIGNRANASSYLSPPPKQTLGTYLFAAGTGTVCSLNQPSIESGPPVPLSQKRHLYVMMNNCLCNNDIHLSFPFLIFIFTCTLYVSRPLSSKFQYISTKLHLSAAT